MGSSARISLDEFGRAAGGGHCKNAAQVLLQRLLDDSEVPYAAFRRPSIAKRAILSCNGVSGILMY